MAEQTAWDRTDVDVKSDLARISHNVSYPVPKRGGTFLYCTHPVDQEVPKLDKNGRKTRYTETKMLPCNSRFRRLKKYRKHFRKSHADSTASQ